MTVQRLPSSDFRRRYSQITEPVEVTALGRVIGTWLPAVPSPLPSAAPETSAAPHPGPKGGAPYVEMPHNGATTRKATVAAYQKYARSLKK